MAIFHFNVKTISRRKGSSAVCAAAYRAGEKLYDQRRRRTYNFERRGDISYSALLLPGCGEAAARLRGALWNAVEAREHGPDACVALEAVFALPKELDAEASGRLAREFVEEAFVRRGMATDLNVHAGTTTGRPEQPHAHALCSTRALRAADLDRLALGEDDALDFGPKLPPWRRRDQLVLWRETLADCINAALARHRIDRRVDHRTYRAQGVDLEPQNKIGPAGARRVLRGEPAERAQDHQDVSGRNGDRIIEDPALAISAITHRQSSFTDADLRDFLRRQTDDPGQFELALAAARASSALIPLGRDGTGVERFTSRELVAAEARLEALGAQLWGALGGQPEVSAAACGQPSPPADFAWAEAEAGPRAGHFEGRRLAILALPSEEARQAVLVHAAAAWIREGRTALGVTATHQRARTLSEKTGLPCAPLSSLDRTAQTDLVLPGRPQIVLVDEAGLLSPRGLERIARAAAGDGCALVVTADPEDFAPGETGAGFRALVSGAHHGRLLEGAPRRAGALQAHDVVSERFGGDEGRTDEDAARLFAARRGLGGMNGQRRARAGSALAAEEEGLASLRARWAHRTVRIMAKAVLEAERGGGASALAQRSRLLARAAGRLEALWPGSAPALAEAAILSPELLSGAASGRTGPMLMAMREAAVQRGRAPPSWICDIDLGLGLGRGRA